MLKKDSKAAKKARTLLTIRVLMPTSCKERMVILNNNPILAAKRFGGRYTGLIGSFRFFTSVSLIIAKGLYLPKSKERKAKSMTSNTGIAIKFVKMYVIDAIKTNNAISLILLSLVVACATFDCVLILSNEL